MSGANKSLSITINKIKTALYALITLVLANWVTSALNEDLIFKMIVRYFYPEETARYIHPFDTIESFIIWFIPACLAILLVIYTSTITVHHFKKKHIYHLSKSKELQRIDYIILAPHIENLHQACQAYQNSDHLYLLLDKQHYWEMEQEIEAYFDDQQKFTLYEVPHKQDLYLLKSNLDRIMRQIILQHNNQDNIGFDLSFSSSVISSVVLLSLLDNNINLTYFTEQGIKSNHINCSIPD